jgi:hypothetical protein
MPWTEQQIVTLLDTNDRAVERAIVAIYERQTADEKQASHTRHDNTVGFRQNHAPRLSFYARLIRGGKHLYPAQLQLARKWTKMYRRQLADIANSKEAAAVAPIKLGAEQLSRVAEALAPREPPVGSWASVARVMAAGDDSGFDWDRWKDEMKEADL